MKSFIEWLSDQEPQYADDLKTSEVEFYKRIYELTTKLELANAIILKSTYFVHSDGHIYAFEDTDISDLRDEGSLTPEETDYAVCLHIKNEAEQGGRR